MKRFSGSIEPGTPTQRPWRLAVLDWEYQIIAGGRLIAAISGHAKDPIIAGGRLIATISGHAKDPREDPQAYADALLLAAAPDLLAACEAVLALDAEQEEPLLPRETYEQARAAVEKAKGGAA